MNKCSMCEENMCWGIQRGELMKNLEEEINKIIITAKRKLYDANLESVNLIMGERKKGY